MSVEMAFFQGIPCTTGFSPRLKKVITRWHLLVTVCSTAVTNYSKGRMFKQILSMWWIFQLSKSSLWHILNCILLERAKLNKLANQLWSTFPNSRISLITQSWHLSSCDHFFLICEWNQRCVQWPEKEVTSTDIWDPDTFCTTTLLVNFQILHKYMYVYIVLPFSSCLHPAQSVCTFSGLLVSCTYTQCIPYGEQFSWLF